MQEAACCSEKPDADACRKALELEHHCPRETEDDSEDWECNFCLEKFWQQWGQLALKGQLALNGDAWHSMGTTGTQWGQLALQLALNGDSWHSMGTAGTQWGRRP